MAAEAAALPAAEPSRPVLKHWSVRLRDALSTYLPLLIMLVLAGLSWWLVRITPTPQPPRAEDAASQAPDFTLYGVEMVRYRADGSREGQVRGRELRHFPVGDRVEIDQPLIRIEHPQGPLEARSLTATVTEEGQRLSLRGEVSLSRGATASQPAFVVEGQAIEIDAREGRSWSSEPVRWTQDGAVVTAAGFEYRQDSQELRLKGPVQARLLPAAPRGR